MAPQEAELENDGEEESARRTELMLMMRPPLPCFIICLAASCVPKRALLAHVCVDANRLATELGERLLERLGTLWVSHIIYDNAGVPPRQFEHDYLTDPAVDADCRAKAHPVRQARCMSAKHPAQAAL
jgi:hypothetical protein